MIHYLKFTAFPIIGFAVLHVMMQGGAWMYAGLLTLFGAVVVGDAVLPDDRGSTRC